MISVALLVVITATAATATVTTTATIAANATTASHLDYVEVQFCGIAVSDRPGCWLGLFAQNATLDAVIPNPTGSTYGSMPFTANAPIKWMLCTDADPAFSASGSGTKAFRLLNVRTPVFFALFTGGATAPVAVAQTPAISFNAVLAPHQVHVALTDTPSALLVQWTSASSDAQQVAWGPQPGVTTATQASAVDTFTADDLCGAPANKEGWFAPGYFHSARISGLQPGQIVFYRVGSDTAGWSAYFQVRGPIGAATDASVRILVTADVGATEPDGASTQWSNPLANVESMSGTTLSRLAEANAVMPADALLHIGDLAYAVGYEAKWELFMEEVQAVASQLPYMTGMGNHERDWPGTGTVGGQDSGGECGTPTQHRFTMPTPSKKQEDGFYSFDVGPVHFTVMFTEVPCGVGSMQYEFLAADFAAVNRTATPWLVLAGHRPMYYIGSPGSFGPDTSSNFCDGAKDLEPLIFKNEVDLALWGHVHNTMVTCPVFNGKCGKASAAGGFAGTVHAVVGNGGQDLSGVPVKWPEWLVYGGNSWGWNYITANATHLSLNFIDDATNTTSYELQLERH